MTTIKQSVSLNGQKLSNNDPKMSIKLDSHPAVQISKIEDDRITYSFIGRVTEDVVINLNVTFTYEGYEPLVVPLTITQKASQVTFVTTDNPVTVQMWERGDTLPFTVTVDGKDVTKELKSVKLGDNKYLVYPTYSDEVSVWELLYSTPMASDQLIPFTFKWEEDGVEWEYSSEGTFKLPAWDGIAFAISPHTEDDPSFTNIKMKTGETVTVNLDFTFKGKPLSPNQVVNDPDLNLTGEEVVVVSAVPGENGLAVTLQANTIGYWGPGVALKKTGETEGYPANEERMSMDYWLPSLEVSSDVITDIPSSIIMGPNETVTMDVTVSVDGWTGPAGDYSLEILEGLEELKAITFIKSGDKYKLTITSNEPFTSGKIEIQSNVVGVVCKTLVPIDIVYNENGKIKYAMTEYTPVPAEDNNFPFSLRDSETNEPLVGLKCRNADVIVDRSTNSVMTGYSSIALDKGEGNYTSRVSLGHVPGRIKIVVEVPDGNLKRKFTSDWIDNVGTQMTGIPTPETLTLGSENTVSFSFSQKRFLDGKIYNGTLSNVVLPPGVSLTDVFVKTADNVYTGKLTLLPEVPSEFTMTIDFREDVDPWGYTWSAVPIKFKTTSE